MSWERRVARAAVIRTSSVRVTVCAPIPSLPPVCACVHACVRAYVRAWVLRDKCLRSWGANVERQPLPPPNTRRHGAALESLLQMPKTPVQGRGELCMSGALHVHAQRGGTPCGSRTCTASLRAEGWRACRSRARVRPFLSGGCRGAQACVQ